MTEPNQPTLEAPADPTSTGTAPGAPDPATTPPSARPTAPKAANADDPVDVASLPANVQALIKGLRAENAKARTDSKAAADEARKQLAQDAARALGLVEEEPDPDALTEQITQAQDRAWSAHVELQVYKLAPGLNADGDALLDSVSFINSLDALVDLDPRSEEFREAVKAKVQEAAAKHPAKTGQAPAPSGNGGPRPDPSQGARGTTNVRPASLGEAFTRHYAAKRP